ncbi:hypothetical protein SOVF_195480 [Spinacia oleracea]|uniref:CR-type domain-containing protein n=1 Tax=Spinacia oleracea TaxID=3562 RepID=A0A9R0IJF5_SPIOL|nr:uncharacterized protein LOC110790027 [Spinacia oleracea]KNA04891.1 hypothetical protein SOVF_195480 [Spinacia oleracea]
METTLQSSSIFQIIPSFSNYHHLRNPALAFRLSNFTINSSISCNATSKAASCSAGDRQRRISSVESHYCYDKDIPEQIIEKPIGLSVVEKEIGDQPRCDDCEAKGAALCATCGGSGLYVDSILECQGIILKVRCLGCGGTGNILCSECGGRGHL